MHDGNVVREEVVRIPGAHIIVRCTVTRPNGRFRSALTVERNWGTDWQGERFRWEQDWLRPTRSLDVLITDWMTGLVPEIAARFNITSTGQLRHELERLIRQPEPKRNTPTPAPVADEPRETTQYVDLGCDPRWPEPELTPIPDEEDIPHAPGPDDTQELRAQDVAAVVAVPPTYTFTGPLMLDAPRVCIDGMVVDAELTVRKAGAFHEALLHVALAGGADTTLRMTNRDPGIVAAWATAYTTAKAVTGELGIHSTVELAEHMAKAFGPGLEAYGRLHPAPVRLEIPPENRGLLSRILARIELRERRKPPKVTWAGEDGLLVQLP